MTTPHSRTSFYDGVCHDRSTLRGILCQQAEHKSAGHVELTNLHKEGFRSIRPLYLEDGTMLSDMGAATLIQHPDNRLAIIFNHNTDKVRRTNVRLNAEGLSETLKHPGVACTDGMIVISAREGDSRGLVKNWVSEALIKHNSLTSMGNAHHGILKRTKENEWRSESISYDILEPSKNDKFSGDISKAYLSCGYGLGLFAETIGEKETFQKILARWRRGLSRDKVPMYRGDLYRVMGDHFSTISEKVLQGFSPHHVTFKKGYESEFSDLVHRKYESGGLLRRIFGRTGLHTTLFLSGLISAGFLIASGTLRTFRTKMTGNFIKSIPGALWQAVSRKGFALLPAAAVATAFFSLYFLTNTIANAKQQQIWMIDNKDDKSNSFYEEKKSEDVMLHRYQTADPEQVAESMALNIRDYNNVPVDAKVYKDEPSFYSLNRLFSTKSVREGSLMEAFTVNGHDISYYDESRGIRRVVLPDLKVAFVTYVHSRENDLEISDAQKKIMDEGEVIKIAENPKTKKLEKTAMTYAEYEYDLKSLTAEFYESNVLTHPDHDAYMAKKAEEKTVTCYLRKLGARLGLA